MDRLRWWVCLGFLVLLGSWTAGAGAEADEVEAGRVLASVGNESITVEQFKQEMARRGGGHAGQYASAEQKRALLDDMIHFEALVRGAIAAGYDQSPEARALFKRMMVDLFKRDHFGSALAEIEVGDEEVDRFYDEHKMEYARPERIQAALIFFSLGPDASKEKKATVETRIEQALEEVRALDPAVPHFGNVAQKYSDDRASRYKGGVVGWIDPKVVDRYKWESEVIEALIKLEQPGEIAPIVRTKTGAYLVRLVDRQEAEALPLSVMREGLRNQLAKKKHQELTRRMMDDLISGLSIEVDEELLESINAPVSAPDEPVAKRPPALPGG